MTCVCIPQPGKEKSRKLLEAFAQGAKGQVAEKPLPGVPAAFFGVVGIEPELRAARAAGRWFYGDNSYFDCARGTHYRFARNALQASGLEHPHWPKAAALGLTAQPWRRDGRHIVVACQSEHFMAEVAEWPGGAVGWQRYVLGQLKQYTERLIVVRHWVRDKALRAKTLQEDLAGAWALVTHSSAAANEALLAGVPVFVTGPCAALAMGLSQISSIEMPRRPDGRAEWAAALAGQQWTVEELRDGTAWRALHA